MNLSNSSCCNPTCDGAIDPFSLWEHELRNTMEVYGLRSIAKVLDFMEAANRRTPEHTYVRVNTVNEAWEYWFAHLMTAARLEAGTQTSRDGNVASEVLNAVTVVKDPTRMIVTSPARKMPMRYAVGELLWYAAGSNKLSDIQKFSGAWDRMSDDGKTVNSGYGHKIQSFYGFDQLEDVLNRLQADPTSRQAVIHIKDARPIGSPTSDTPCTLSLQFILRDNKLNLTVTMRSNDIWTGMPYDMFSFCCLQVYTAMRLGVEVGTYTHQAASLHLYERSIKEAIKAVPAMGCEAK